MAQFHFGDLMLTTVSRIGHLVPLAHLRDHYKLCIRLGVFAFVNLIFIWTFEIFFLSVYKKLRILFRSFW